MAELQKVSAVPFSLSRLMLFSTMLLHGTVSLHANFMALEVFEVPLIFLYMTWVIFTADVCVRTTTNNITSVSKSRRTQQNVILNE